MCLYAYDVSCLSPLCVFVFVGVCRFVCVCVCVCVWRVACARVCLSGVSGVAGIMFDVLSPRRLGPSRSMASSSSSSSSNSSR